MSTVAKANCFDRKMKRGSERERERIRVRQREGGRQGEREEESGRQRDEQFCHCLQQAAFVQLLKLSKDNHKTKQRIIERAKQKK